MKNRIKIFLIIIPLLFLTGCYKEYKIEILEDKSAIETAKINEENYILCQWETELGHFCDVEKQFYILFDYYADQTLDYQINKSIGKDISNGDTSVELKKTYNSINEIMTSKILNEYYKDVSVMENEGVFTIEAANYNKFNRFTGIDLAQYTTIYIKSYYKVENTTATLHDKGENVYKISFKGEPSNFKFVVNTNIPFKSQSRANVKEVILVIGIVLASLILIAVIINLYNKKRSDK